MAMHRLAAMVVAGLLLAAPAAPAHGADAVTVARQIVAMAHPPLEREHCEDVFITDLQSRYNRTWNDADIHRAMTILIDEFCLFINRHYIDFMIDRYIDGVNSQSDELEVIREFLSLSWVAVWLEKYFPSYVRQSANDYYTRLFVCFFVQNPDWTRDRQFMLPIFAADLTIGCSIPSGKPDLLTRRSDEIEMVDEILRTLSGERAPPDPFLDRSQSDEQLKYVAEERADLSGDADRFLREFDESVKPIIGRWDADRRQYTSRYLFMDQFERPQIEAIRKFLRTAGGEAFARLYQGDVDARAWSHARFPAGTAVMDDFIAAHRDTLAQMNLRD